MRSHHRWILLLIALGILGRGSMALLSRAEPSYWWSLNQADRVVVAEVEELWATRSFKYQLICFGSRSLETTRRAVVGLGNLLDQGFELLVDEYWDGPSNCYVPRVLHARVRVEQDLKGAGDSRLVVRMGEDSEAYLVPGERVVAMLVRQGIGWRPVGSYRSVLLARDEAEFEQVTRWARRGLGYLAAGARSEPSAWRVQALALPTLFAYPFRDLNPAELGLLAERVGNFEVLGPSLVLSLEQLRGIPDSQVDAAGVELLEAELAVGQASWRLDDLFRLVMERVRADEDLSSRLAASRYVCRPLDDLSDCWQIAKRELGLEVEDDPELQQRAKEVHDWHATVGPRWAEVTARLTPRAD